MTGIFWTVVCAGAVVMAAGALIVLSEHVEDYKRDKARKDKGQDNGSHN